MNRHGLFVRGGHPTDEMREKIKQGVKRHWDRARKRSIKQQAARARTEQITRWVDDELAKVKRR